MKKILISLTLLVSLQAWSQVDTLREENIRKIGDILFQNLDPNIYGPNLLNRSFSSGQITEKQAYGDFNQIHSVAEFFELYQDIAFSYTDSTYLMPNMLFAENLNNIYMENEMNTSTDELVIPFGFLFHTMSFIDTSLINSNNFSVNNFHVVPLMEESEIYSTITLKSAAILEIDPDSGYDTATIQYNPSLISVSPDISNLQLRINCGAGFQDFNAANSSVGFSRTSDSLIGQIAFSYDKNGMNLKDTLSFYLTTKGDESEKGSNKWDYDEPFSRPYGISYRYGVKTGCGNEDRKIRRPVIIVPPYKPSLMPKSLNAYYEQFNYKSLISSLADLGYDVIFIKQMPSNANLDAAGQTLADFIDYINDKKASDYPNESWENVVIGYSMGGQVARYALKLKEKEHMVSGVAHHHTRLFIPYDSPNHGANIPMFAQLVYRELSSTNIFAAISNFYLLDGASQEMAVSHVYFSNITSVSNSNVVLINPAPSPLRNQFMNSLNNDFNHTFTPMSDLRRSYPSFTRNVAVSTGNNDQDYEDQFSLNPGKLLFSQEVLAATLAGPFYKLRRLYASKYESQTTVFRNYEKMLTFLIPITIANHDYRTVYAKEWDMAQGGYKDQFYDEAPFGYASGAVPILRSSGNFWGQKYYDKHVSFLPMVSALGINPSIWNNNLFYNLKDEGLMYQKTSDIPTNKSDLFGYPNLAHPSNHFTITPFEAVYCDPQTYEHIELQKTIDDDDDNNNNDGLSDVYLVHTRNFILDEVEADVVGLQNKVIGKNHIQGVPTYKYKAWYRAYDRIDIGNQVTPKTDPGDYVIEATGDITVHAGQTISIKPGFHAQNGSEFHAFIAYDCGRPRGMILSEDNNDQNVPVESTNYSRSEDSKLSKEEEPDILIYPNPSGGNFRILFPLNCEGNFFISDIQGRIHIESTFNQESSNQSCTLDKGVYFLQCKIGDLIILTKQIIVL